MSNPLGSLGWAAILLLVACGSDRAAGGGDRERRLYALGGSFVAGFPYEPAYAWPERLAQLAAGTLGEGGIEVVNLGERGLDSAGAAGIVQGRLAHEPPRGVRPSGARDIAVICLGNNEMLRLADPAGISPERPGPSAGRRARAWAVWEDRLIAFARQLPDLAVLLCVPPSNVDGWPPNQGADAQAAWTAGRPLDAMEADGFPTRVPPSVRARLKARAAAEGIAFVDLQDAFPPPTAAWFFDDHHPTAAGQARAADAVLAALLQAGLLPEAAWPPARSDVPPAAQERALIDAVRLLAKKIGFHQDPPAVAAMGLSVVAQARLAHPEPEAGLDLGEAVFRMVRGERGAAVSLVERARRLDRARVDAALPMLPALAALGAGAAPPGER